MDGVAPEWQGRLDRLVYMATLGKAAGVAGAFVAGHPDVVEWIMQKARTYMFATAAPAMIAEALRASVGLIATEGWRRTHLASLREQLRTGLAQAVPWDLWPSDTAIQPLVIGRNEAALLVMGALDRSGVWVPAIRPPTVPKGTARLRISLSSAHTEGHVAQLIDALVEAAR
jgi:8-amino-7-oxononanoate synthase